MKIFLHAKDGRSWISSPFGKFRQFPFQSFGGCQHMIISCNKEIQTTLWFFLNYCRMGVILMDFVTQSHVLPARISDFVQNPSKWQPFINIFKESKCNLDLFVTTDNCVLLFLDKWIGFSTNLKREFYKFSWTTIVRSKTVFYDILKITGIFWTLRRLSTFYVVITAVILKYWRKF